MVVGCPPLSTYLPALFFLLLPLPRGRGNVEARRVLSWNTEEWEKQRLGHHQVSRGSILQVASSTMKLWTSHGHTEYLCLGPMPGLLPACLHSPLADLDILLPAAGPEGNLALTAGSQSSLESPPPTPEDLELSKTDGARGSMAVVSSDCLQSPHPVPSCRRGEPTGETATCSWRGQWPQRWL